MSPSRHRTLSVDIERWPVAGAFTIARSSLTEIVVVVASLKDGERVLGRGECRPYPRYGETPAQVASDILSHRDILERGERGNLLELCHGLPSGAASNAMESLVVDMVTRELCEPVWYWLDVPKPRPRITAYTLSMGSPESMAQAARDAGGYPLLKVKIGGDDPFAQLRAVVEARPEAELIVDANESLDGDGLVRLCETIADAPFTTGKVVLIEQPVPASGSANGPARLPWLPETAPPVCADESLHSVDDLPRLREAGYRAVNVKLDKAGGPIKARDLMVEARRQGFVVMAGCMVGTSLAMTPMAHLVELADVIDLDGPLLLAKDREPSLVYDGAEMRLPKALM